MTSWSPGGNPEQRFGSTGGETGASQPAAGPSYGAPPWGAAQQQPYGQPHGPQGWPPQQNPYGYGYGQYGQPAGMPYATSGYVTIPNLGTVKVATIGQRFLARLIDAAIYVVVAIIFLVLGVAGLAGSSHTATDAYGNTYSTASDAGVLGFLAAIALVFVFTFFYEWLFVAFKGQTLGKMAMGVKVVREQDGQVPGLGKAFVRQLLPNIGSALCWLLGLLFYISVFFDNSGRNQTWYDKAATDLVISTK